MNALAYLCSVAAITGVVGGGVYYAAQPAAPSFQQQSEAGFRLGERIGQRVQAEIAATPQFKQCEAELESGDPDLVKAVKAWEAYLPAQNARFTTLQTCAMDARQSDN